ncbi:YeeE/YedE family protein [Pontixanthobacter aquaemixtae]|uniref:YeeE/YedE family protein n=1 Tax=Pontixanthobacter aquaemixtae TaxID=1958940 RepID=A0A844ZLG6_9SPHN|nr:YeeE/YedE thiosulfate transporter family protein [Pontixanthobacter aquaemixtae]MXO89261.1 YeeE/YedE family protein [Pontixanthobacter aquaemixtae]
MTLPGFPDATPLAGLGGGILIGLAAALMLLGVGRIAGVSGIASRATGISDSSLRKSSAWIFLLGLPFGALVVIAAIDRLEPSFANPMLLAVAGLLVGAGTRLGSGCTSGHGVCGMSRLSPRSLVATATFMAFGIATVATMNALGLKVLP